MYNGDLTRPDYYSFLEIPTSFKENLAVGRIRNLFNAYQNHSHTGTLADGIQIDSYGLVEHIALRGSVTIDSPTFKVDSVNHRVGINTLFPVSRLGINGNLAVGIYHSMAAPENGAIISGSVGVGVEEPITKLDVAGTARCVVGGVEFYMVPKGGIIMWDGYISDIPSGWQFCNGAGGLTPDLRERFVIGANADTGGTYNVYATGGLAEVVLSINQMAKHNHGATVGNNDAHHAHTGTAQDGGLHNHPISVVNVDQGGGQNSFAAADARTGESQPRYTNDAGTHAHAVGINASTTFHKHSVTILESGNNEAHENRPPYIALAFIKCVGI